MSAARRAYSSTVTSPVHLFLGVAIAVMATAWVGAAGAGTVVAVAVGAVLVLTSILVSTVRVLIGGGRVVLGWGPFAWPRRSVAIESVAEVAAEDLTTAQVFGLGVPWSRRATRMTIRSGPTLLLRLRDGEPIRVSASNPRDAVELVRLPPDRTAPVPTTMTTATEEQTMIEEPSTRRPWFGPKRVGYGIRPQTWQGMALVIGAAVVLVVLVRLLAG